MSDKLPPLSRWASPGASARATSSERGRANSILLRLLAKLRPAPEREAQSPCVKEPDAPIDHIELAIRRHLMPGAVAFDVGANQGLYSRVMAGIAGRVVAFEPNPELAAHFRKDMPANVMLVEAAVSDEAGEATLLIDDREGVGAVASSLMQLNGMEECTRPVTVRTITLDGFCAEHGIAPRFIKIDVEGWEPHVMRGAGAVLRTHRPVVLFEFWETHYQRYLPMFRDLSVTHHLVRVGDGVDVLEFYAENANQQGSVDVLCVPR